MQRENHHISVGQHSPEEFFSKHAEAYSKSSPHAHGQDLARLVELLKPEPQEIALDLATGTGFTALEFAPKVKEVLATDITQEMLDEAKKLAVKRGVGNITFELADAFSLPYPDASFDLVTCRRAPHHFGDIRKFLSEAKRVLRIGGRLGIADMSPREGSEDFINTIERLRDGTHATALTLLQWKSLLSESGFEIIGGEILFEDVTFEQWLSPVKLGGNEELAVRKEWIKASTEVRNLVRVIEKDGIVSSWSRSLAVLAARRH